MHELVEVAVVFDRVAVGVEEGGVPVTQGIVAIGTVEGQATMPVLSLVRVIVPEPAESTQLALPVPAISAEDGAGLKPS